MAATWHGDDGPHISLPNSQPCIGGSKGVRQGYRQGWWKRSKFRWNGRQLTLDKTVASRVWWHTQGSSGRPASDLGWGSSSKTAPGSLSTGSPAGPPLLKKRRDVQSGQRKGRKGAAAPYPSVAVRDIVDTEMVLREAGLRTVCFGWKGDRPWVRLETEKHFLYCHHWSDEKWKSSMAGGGGEKKRFQYCSDSSGTILYLRVLQGHSGRSLIDPTVQDNVLIPDDFFEYIYHQRCAINLHSIINSGLIPGSQNLSNRQTVFFLPVDPMDKNHKDPDTIDLHAPRLAQYMQTARKKHHSRL